MSRNPKRFYHTTPRGVKMLLPRASSPEEIDNEDEEENATDFRNDGTNMASLRMDEMKREREEGEERLKERIDALEKEIAELKAKEKEAGPGPSSSKLPTGLSNLVHHLYVQSEMKWDFNENYKSAGNSHVTLTIVNALADGECATPTKRKKAVNRYFESLRRKYKEELMTPTSKSATKRRRTSISRRHKLYNQRSKIDLLPHDEVLWGKLNAWAMSDEESEEEGLRVLRTPGWRDSASTKLIRRIDKAMGSVRRYGAETDRMPNQFCQAFISPDCVSPDNL